MPNPKLHQRLKAAGKDALLASVEELAKKLRIHTVDQPEQRGLGHAVHQAAKHINEEPFLCLLGDTIFSGELLPASQLVQAYQEFRTTIIGLEQVPAERVDRYGICGGAMIKADVMNRTVYLPLRDIVGHLGLPYTDSISLETLTIRSGNNRLVVTKNSALISYNDQIILLPSPIACSVAGERRLLS